MGLSTHVLDTMHGRPAGGMQVELYTTKGPDTTLVRRFTLDGDGRNPEGPLYDTASLAKGPYRLVFDVAGYFRSCATARCRYRRRCPCAAARGRAARRGPCVRSRASLRARATARASS